MRHRSNIMMISRTGRIRRKSGRRRRRRKWHGKKLEKIYPNIFVCTFFLRSILMPMSFTFSVIAHRVRYRAQFRVATILFWKGFFFFSCRDAPTEPIYDKNAEKVNNTIYFHYFLSDATILHIFFFFAAYTSHRIPTKPKPSIALQMRTELRRDTAIYVSHSIVKTNDENREHWTRWLGEKLRQTVTLRFYRVGRTIVADE